MIKKQFGVNTICTHIGEIEDKQFKGAVSPMYLSSSYEFLDVDVKRYPRYFNTPNQEFLSKKIAALEGAEEAIIFGSGMAAISHMFLAFLQKGDHLVVQNTLYGGTVNFIKEEFPKYGIEYTFTNGYKAKDFEDAIQENTKLIHIETPSNPLLTITDIRDITQLAKSKKILTSIDNTFASPVNQKPIDFGIDMVMHSATKYFGGHSDICAGAVASSAEHIQRIWNVSKNLGGIPVPGLLISNISFLIEVPFDIFVVDTILLLAYFTASFSTSNEVLIFIPLEISTSLNPSTMFENPSVSKDNL